MMIGLKKSLRNWKSFIKCIHRHSFFYSSMFVLSDIFTKQHMGSSLISATLHTRFQSVSLSLKKQERQCKIKHKNQHQ